MKQKTAKELLNAAILEEEKKQFDELILLKQQFHFTYQSLRPLNLIKSTLEELTQTPELKNTIIKDVIGLATGYLTKKVVVGASRNPIRKIFGFFFQYAVTDIVSKNSEGIRIAGERLIYSIVSLVKDVKKQ
jgi:hypothetical protein